jgi:hypothetical protein
VIGRDKAFRRFRNTKCVELVEAYHDDGKRFVVHDDEKLTAFLELQRSVRMDVGRENLRQNEAAKANQQHSIAPFV